MIPQAITIPRHRDPVARVSLFVCVGLVAWIAVMQPAPQRADAGEIIIIQATPQLPIGQADRALAAPAEVQQQQPTQAPESTAAPPMQVQVVELAPPTPMPVQVGEDSAGAETPSGNPWAGMETVNGHSFVPTPDRYAGMDSVNYAYVSPEDYNSLPVLPFDNTPAAPTTAPDARDYQWSRQRTR